MLCSGAFATPESDVLAINRRKEGGALSPRGDMRNHVLLAFRAGGVTMGGDEEISGNGPRPPNERSGNEEFAAPPSSQVDSLSN